MSSNVILFHSKVEYAEALINNIKSLGNSISDFSINISEVLQRVEENVRIMKEKVGNEKLAKKMFMDGIYIEAIGKIDEIIASLENSLLYLQIISNCNSINSLENLDEVELNNIVNSLIEELKKVKMEDFSCFLDYDKTIRLLYETIYKIIKLEYINSCLTSSRLYDYVSSDRADRIFISTLIMEDIRITRESGKNTVKLEQIISSINVNLFDEELYFNKELIKEITCIYERERIINTSQKRVLSLSKDYQENLLEIEKSNEEYDDIDVTITSANDTLKKKKRQKFGDIFRAITSCIISVSVCWRLFIGLSSEEIKKIKTVKTVTNSTTLDLKNREEEYLPEDGNYIYLEMFDPWKKDTSGYSRDTYKFALPYEEYKDKELDEILAYENLYPLVLDLSDAEKGTEFSQELAYADLYSDTFYELIKIEQIPDDFIYTQLFGNKMSFLISFIFFNLAFFPHILDNISLLRVHKKNVWNKEKLEKYKDEINRLIGDREELKRRITYLLLTNQEIKMRYEEILKDPVLKEALNDYIKKECNHLESVSIDDLGSSQGKRRILEK